MSHQTVPNFWFHFLLPVLPWSSPECLQDEVYRNKVKQSNERLLALVKASMDLVVAIGLLQLAPKKITPRVTGGFGFLSSLISCYQVCFSFKVEDKSIFFFQIWMDFFFYLTVQLLPSSAKSKTTWNVCPLFIGTPEWSIIIADSYGCIL